MKKPILFGKYLLLERINVGGMAEVFLARSRGVHGFKRLLAIKKILPTMAEDKEFIAMFIDEAKIASDLNHASIVQIYELAKVAEDYYITMEFVHGKDLRYIQERMTAEGRPMPLNLAVFIAFRICEALDYAHNKRDPSGKHLGIIHRDVSPQNVIISYEGEIKICDFGIAKAANRSQKTQAGVLKGKFGYMSPEQVRGLPLDGRSDLFTVGTLLYEMVTLQRLFLGESDFSTLEKVRNADVVPPSTYNHDIPEQLEQIILRALAKEVEDRFQNAAEMADALQEFMSSQGMTGPRDLGNFVKEVFREDYEAELQRLEFYQNLPDAIVAQAEREHRQAQQEKSTQTADAPEAAEIDEDQKTLVFASHGDAAAEDMAGAQTRIFGQDEPAPELADARTMIFDEAAVEPVHEAPTRALSERPELPAPRSAPKAKAGGASKTPWVVLLAVLCAVLLGWSVIATVRLVRQQAAVGPASLEILTEPAVGLEVSVDGRRLATVTPQLVSPIAPGEHLVQIRKSGYRTVERRIKIGPGMRLVLDVSLSRAPESERPGKPRAGLAAGRPEKPAPVSDTKPAAASDGGSPGSQAGTAAAGPRDADRRAAVAKSELVVDSQPRAAAVYLGSRWVGRTPLKLSDLDGRELLVMVRKRGYRPRRQQIRLQPGEKKRLLVKLEKKPRTRPPAAPVVDAAPPESRGSGFGYLVANTRPWSKVYVDGRYSGRDTPIAPDKKLKLKAGRHKIMFETSSGKRYVFEVEIKADEITKLIKKLEG